MLISVGRFALFLRSWCECAGFEHGVIGSPQIVTDCVRLGAQMKMLKLEILAGMVALVAVGSTPVVRAQSNANIESQVDAVFAPWNKPKSPGCTCAAIKDGKTVYSKGFGLADLEHDAPLNGDSVFYIASTTKQFTAAAVGLLVLDGKVSQQDDIRKYFPEFKHLSTAVTVEQLIHHTSGIRDYLQLMSLLGHLDTARFDNEFVVKLLARQKALNFEPGSEFLYSNSNYLLLADLVRRVSGKSLQDFARERIFTPLGMHATRFGDNVNEIVPNRVISYGVGPGGNTIQFVKVIEAYGAGNLLTTANDLARWDENFYSARVGGEALLELQKTVGVLKGGAKTDYGFGLGYEQFRGQPAVSHGGAFLGFRTEMIRFPQQRFTAVVLCNSGTINPGELARRVASIYLADVLDPVPAAEPVTPRTEIKVDPSIYDRYVGDYALDEHPQFVMSIIREGDTLLIHPSGQDRLQLFPESETKFFSKVVDAQITFHREADGSVNRITLHQNGDRDAKRRKPFTIEATALNEYAGKYYSDELDGTLEFVVQDGQLTLVNPQGQRFKLRASDRDLFQGDQGQIAFRRDAGGKIDGMSYSGGRVRNIAFGRK